MDHKFEVIIPLVPPDAYYIFRGKQVTEKEFAKRQFEELVITDASSSVHTFYLTPAEVLEKFSDLLTREQIEKLKSYGSI